MIWVVGCAVVGIVMAIAAALVFREAARLSEDPPDAVFDPDDAVGWVVTHLDDLVAATLTEADVARIIGFQMEFFEGSGVSQQGDSPEAEVFLLLTLEETTDFIMARCAETGEAYIVEQVRGVVESQGDYLRFIGAVGQPVEDDD